LRNFNGKSNSRNTARPQSLHLQAMPAGEALNSWNKGRESKQTQDWSKYITPPSATFKTLNYLRKT